MRIGVLGSGNGSNLQAIIDAIESGKLKNVEIAIVLSDVHNAKILERARKHKIPAQFIHPGKFKTKLEPEVEKEYIEALKEADVEWVVLAGFMRVIKSKMLHAFPYQIINIHPSLLPAFKGLEAWKQALDYGAKYTGCTVHIVNMDVDSGPILLQGVVPIEEEDTPETLHERIHAVEHELYPKALQLLANDQFVLRGRRTRIKENSSPVK